MIEDANGNLHRERGRPGAGQFAPQLHSAPEVHLPLDGGEMDPEIVVSRRSLINVITALGEHREALTVLGGHAVIEMTQGVEDVPPDDATRDGDLGVTPSLLLPHPRLAETMAALGYEQEYSDRPGIWSPVTQCHLNVHERDTVDLIAPFAVSYEEGSKRPRRGARVGEHGRKAVSATPGTELSTIDRRWMTLRSFDDAPGVDAYVAGGSALLCAKAYKLHDRMNEEELTRNAARLRPKDFADVYRLMRATPPEAAAGVFSRGAGTARIGDSVTVGRERLLSVLADERYAAGVIASAWAEEGREDEFADFTARWRDVFAAA